MPRLHNSAWLRPALAFLALAGLLALSACGGGSGAVQAPGNVQTPPTAVTVIPAQQTIYPGTPAAFTISGGVPPYQAFSSNSAILPVAQNVGGNQVVLLANSVSAATTVTVTVQDNVGQTAAATVQVSPAVLFPSGLTITASQGTCGSGAICTGETGTARVQGTGIAGAALAGRQIRFDVVYGAFGLLSTNPAAPLVQTLTVTTDNAGVAQVGIQALVDVTTQPAQLRATDIATGQALIGNFTIVRNQDGSQFITVIPDTATITGGTPPACSSGAVVDYRIYGGTPPYRVTSSFPGAVNILNSTVAVSGGFFEVRTNGTCVNPLTFSILDSAGKQTTATLVNTPASGSTGGGGSSPLVVTPISQGDNTTSCAGTFTVSISGGTPPYNISQTSSSTAPFALANFPNTLAQPGTASFSGLTGNSGSPVTYTFLITDSGFSPPAGQSISITCLVP
ncbi:MAG TPA: hypothetical protein VGR63_05535 [Casimicrobiaceae bacterium]|nr:hypothetical protein [Casimicrobiaceae bacterium]